MTCVFCKYGQTAPGEATVTLQRGDSTVIVKRTSAEICENCGEYYLDEDVSAKVFEQAEAAVRAGAEVSVQRYAA